VKFFEIYFSIRMLQIENDEYFYDALICEQCLSQVKHAYSFRRKIKDFDENYFTLKRFSLQNSLEIEALSDSETKTLGRSEINSDDKEEQFSVIEVQSDDEDELEDILVINDSDYEFETLVEFQEPSKAVNVTSETESSPFKCPTCDHSYKSKRTLRFHQKKKHIREAEQKVKKFQCYKCKNFYSSIASLRQHIKILHLNLNQFVCCFCNMKFNLKSSYDRHINQHYTNPEFKPKKPKPVLMRKLL
jgi:uncharacterized C2H2 Zn-finger protein